MKAIFKSLSLNHNFFNILFLSPKYVKLFLKDQIELETSNLSEKCDIFFIIGKVSGVKVKKKMKHTLIKITRDDSAQCPIS